MSSRLGFLDLNQINGPDEEFMVPRLCMLNIVVFACVDQKLNQNNHAPRDRMTAPHAACRPLNICAFLLTRSGKPIFSMPLKSVTQPKTVMTTLQSQTQMLCTTTVPKPSKKVM